MASRIDQLKQFIAEDPNDPFPRYGLALEYLHDQPELAWNSFQELMTRFPEYLPTYYPAAHLGIELGRPQEADRIFQEGIAVARKLGDHKTRYELQQAFDQWVFDRE